METALKRQTIPIRIDKSHIVTIGERLYAQSLELVRELVSNAFDADATHVWIDLAPYTLTVKDNGSGMDEAGLIQFFTIGSEEKRFHNKSPVFGRTRIGQFGIGKFSVLSACDVFRVFSQKGVFAAKVTFDKQLWQHIEGWELPIEHLAPEPQRGDGTIVTMERLTKQLTLPDIERFIRERVPLKVPNFNVYLNSRLVEPVVVPGKKYPIQISTIYGKISGEIVIPNFEHHSRNQERGIECFVNDVFIKREMFGFDYHQGFLTHRLTGEIHADFVPVTSDRSRFVTDSEQYEEFNRLMRLAILDILKQQKEHADLKEVHKADTVIRDALRHIFKAIKKNPSFAAETRLPVEIHQPMTKNKEEPLAASEVVNSVVREQPVSKMQSSYESEPNKNSSLEGLSPKESRKVDRTAPRVRVRAITGKEVLARKTQIGSFSIVCQAESLGETQPPVISEGGIIFVNRDHPLFRRLSKNQEALTFYVSALIAQEIARLRCTDPREAFILQNQIMTDAWV